MKEQKSLQDAKVKRILVVGVVLVIVCVVCLFISVRYADKYRRKVTETSVMEQNLDYLKQNVKKLDMKIRELEFVRYDLSQEKEQISKECSTIKEKYKSLAKTIKSLKNDVIDMQKILKFLETDRDDQLVGVEESSDKETQLLALKSRNDELVSALATKTKEKMILKIALESQAKRLGLSEKYDPELKGILKDFVTSLQ